MLEAKSSSPVSRPEKEGPNWKKSWAHKTLQSRIAEAKSRDPSATDFAHLISNGAHGDIDLRSNLGNAGELIRDLKRFTLYEDGDLLVINKSPHLISVGNPDSQFKIGATEVVRCLKGDSVLNAHRLDRATSGVLVFGKNYDALYGLFEQFFDKSESGMTKIYATLVEGEFKDPEEQKVDAVINDKDRGRVHIVRGNGDSVANSSGKDSTTLFKPLTLYETKDPHPKPITLARVQIVTGRKHQIRVVSADCLGYPVVGDSLYNPKSTVKAPRQMLHAYGLELRHPRTGKQMSFIADMPPDFNEVFENLSEIKNYK